MKAIIIKNKPFAKTPTKNMRSMLSASWKSMSEFVEKSEEYRQKNICHRIKVLK